MKRIRRKITTMLAAIGVAAAVAAPVAAGPAEMDLLSSYVGDWSGASMLVGGQAPEPFRCRLKVSKGNQAKINYSGRCTLVNMNLSIAGTIMFDDRSQRYQAAMSSNAGFAGQAVGRRNGEQIVFNLQEQQVDRGGNNIRIGSIIHLVADSIKVDFEVEFNNSGQVLTASVPFAR